MDIIPFPGNDQTTVEADVSSEQDMMRRAAAASVTLAAPGHVFTLAWLEAAFGLGDKPEDTVSFERWHVMRARLIDAWRTEMLTVHRVHIENRPGRGYLVIAPEETPFVAVKVAMREFRRAIRQASDKIQYAPDGLSDRQRQDRMDALAFVGRVELAIQHARPKPPRPGQRMKRAG